MRRFLFLAFIMFIVTGGALLFGGEYDAATPGSGNSVNSNADSDQPYFLLYRAMELAEARVHKGELHYWASLEPGNAPLTATVLEEQADLLLKRLAPRFDPAYAYTRIESNYNVIPARVGVQDEGGLPDFILVEREGEFYHGSRLRLLLQGMEEKGERTVHLFITIYEEGEASRLGDLARRLPTQLDVDTRSSSLTFSLAGLIPVVMESEGMEQLAVQIAGKLGARQVESMREEFMVSVTGSSPLLKHVSGGDTLPVNFNLALRNDNYDEYTTIWVGTPLISGMY